MPWPRTMLYVYVYAVINSQQEEQLEEPYNQSPP